MPSTRTSARNHHGKVWDFLHRIRYPRAFFNLDGPETRQFERSMESLEQTLARNVGCNCPIGTPIAA